MGGMRFHRRAMALFLLLVLQLAVGSGARAQDLRYLLFDPEPFNPASPLDSAVNDAGLPSSPDPQLGRRVPLRSWLETHSSEQSLEVRDLQRDIASYQSAIDELETMEGPFSPKLPQQQMALAAALQANGEYEAALKQIELANHITRVNLGLFSIEQIPILEQMIDNLMQQGNFLAADEKQNYLLFLQQKNYEVFSPELLPALHNFGEWNLFAFNNGPVSRSFALPKDVKVDALSFRIQSLINAQHAYTNIIDIILRNFGFTDPRLLDAEMRLVLTNYLFATSFVGNVEPMTFNNPNDSSAIFNNQRPLQPVSHMGFRHGREALERRRDYLLETPGSDPVELARVSLDIADWMLFFNKQRNQALDIYEGTYEEFREQLPPDSLKELFEPEHPVMLPSFLYPAYSRRALGIPDEQAINYQGYIDVSFELSRQGRATSIKVLGKQGEEVEAVQERLLRNLRRSQFRPRLDNGKIRTKDEVHVRYHYAY